MIDTTMRKEQMAKGERTANNIALLRSMKKITMPDSPRTVKVKESQMAETVRKVVEYTDYPIWTVGGRPLIRRVEKVLMPNGGYRYPVTYIDMTPSSVNE